MQTIPPDLDTGSIEIAGRDVFYRVAGPARGPGVVLLHGAGNGDGRDWYFSAFADLAKTRRVVAFDRPGIGASDPIPEGDDPRAQARHLAAAARALGHPAPLVIGHSYGGAVALAWAAAAPDLPGLVLLAPVAFPLAVPEAALRIMAGPLGAGLAWFVTRLMRKAVMKQAITRAFDPQPVPPDYWSYAMSELMKNPAELIQNAREITRAARALAQMAPHYPEIDMPVELFSGDHDNSLPHRQQADRLAEALPQVDYHLLEGMGHMLHHFIQPQITGAVDRLIPA